MLDSNYGGSVAALLLARWGSLVSCGVVTSPVADWRDHGERSYSLLDGAADPYMALLTARWPC